ncbi:hypothetical protein E4T66_13855 [Sinimarinibacterium sp. CAU 1509]|uniref:hypothetical protein n=1 Tax=Sinimarinibacterium sp. CAU 1509 TaxID=2562283 RepID=UPI0010AD1D4A|nr:hypothetical protein [Sinimarinibacterium sp. CAU 1509]TJY59463.1 hypothetical protein E4T66_13855 [Sinimarinibacterium sp. CAU 1509]
MHARKSVITSIALLACLPSLVGCAGPHTHSDTDDAESVFKTICVNTPTASALTSHDTLEGLPPDAATAQRIQSAFESNILRFKRAIRAIRYEHQGYLLVLTLHPDGTVADAIVWARNISTGDTEKRLLEVTRDIRFPPEVVASCPTFSYSIHLRWR